MRYITDHNQLTLGAFYLMYWGKFGRYLGKSYQVTVDGVCCRGLKINGRDTTDKFVIAMVNNHPIPKVFELTEEEYEFYAKCVFS